MLLLCCAVEHAKALLLRKSSTSATGLHGRRCKFIRDDRRQGAGEIRLARSILHSLPRSIVSSLIRFHYPCFLYPPLPLPLSLALPCALSLNLSLSLSISPRVSLPASPSLLTSRPLWATARVRNYMRERDSEGRRESARVMVTGLSSKERRGRDNTMQVKCRKGRRVTISDNLTDRRNLRCDLAESDSRNCWAGLGEQGRTRTGSASGRNQSD